MMRPTLRRLAENISARPLTLQEASAALYPPKPLLRRLLRAHRYLPHEMRSLGDNYVKDEFRRHRKVDNPVYVIGFLTQWKLYLEGLPGPSEGEGFKGKRLDPMLMEKMSKEQLGQLYEVMHVTKDIWKPVEDFDGKDEKS